MLCNDFPRTLTLLACFFTLRLCGCAVADDSAPIAHPDRVTTVESTPLHVSVMANDHAPKGRPLEIVGATGGRHGNVTISESLVGWWCFDGDAIAEGTADASRFHNAAMVSGGMTDANVVAGRLGRALSFDGKDDRLTTGVFPDLGDVYTVSVWVKGVVENGTIVQHYNRIDFEDVERGWRLTISPQKQQITLDSDGHNEIRAMGVVPPVDDGAWHHIVGVKNGRRGWIYYDGKLVESEQFAKPTTYHPEQPLRMMWGKDESGTHTQATLDEVRVYNRALSAEEVRSLYAATLADVSPQQLYTVTYTPEEGYVGDDAFAYTISDGTNEATAEVNVAVTARKLTAQDVRVCVTGYDTNPPDPFPGMGQFIGWAEAIERMPDGSILLVHSAGYGHVSSASPRDVRGGSNGPDAPTGGRSMACRSYDNGKTWTKPVTVIDHRLDDRPDALHVCRDGTVLCFVNINASWSGYPKAPPGFENDIDGLNDKQMVLRSHDSGQTWSEPIWIKSPGTFYERAHGRPIELADGAILWATYCEDVGGPESGGPSRGGEHPLFGAIHRSTDSGLTWETISEIRLKNDDVDEPAIGHLKDGRLIMVKRPDAAILYSNDKGMTWTHAGRSVKVGGPTFRAPQVVVLEDGTIVVLATWHVFGYGKGLPHLCAWISTDNGLTWSRDGEGLVVDNTTYGYPGFFVMEDQSILISYCESASAPNRVYVVRIKVNEARDGIDFLPL